MFSGFDVPLEQVLGKLGWKTLEERHEIKLTKYMSKVIQGDCTEILSNLFENCNNEKYNLRSSGKLLRLPSVVQDNSGEAYNLFYLAQLP